MTFDLRLGDCRRLLAEMEAESVSLVCSSPPYHGLRSYSTEPQLWGVTDADCAHEWGEVVKPAANGIVHSAMQGKTLNGQSGTRQPKVSAMCTRCGCWRGELGSEPCVDCMAWTGLVAECGACYVCHLREVFRGVWRVLHPSGVIALNLGDSYCSTAPGTRNAPQRKGSKSHPEQWANYRIPTPAGLKPKDLMGVPWRVVMALQADGWYWRSVSPWIKRAAMPESARDRPTNALEWVFLLSKASTYFWDSDAVRQAHTVGTAERFGNGRAGRIAVGPKGYDPLGNNGRASGTLGLLEHGRSFRNTDTYFAALDAEIALLTMLRNGGGVRVDEDGLPIALDINPQATKEQHFAAFGTNLVEPFVKAGSSERGVCASCLAPWRRVVERAELVLTHHKKPTPTSRGDMRRDPGNRTDLQPTPGAFYPSETLGWQPTCRCNGHFERREVETSKPPTFGLADTEPERFTMGKQRDWKRSSHTGEGDRRAAETVTETVEVYVPHIPLSEHPITPATVVDCFSGTGTVPLVADRLGRHGIGLELSAAYVELARRRLASDAPLWNGAELAAPSAVEMGLFGADGAAS